MDPDIEEQEFQRQQDEEFWDGKRRDGEQSRQQRGRQPTARGPEADDPRLGRGAAEHLRSSVTDSTTSFDAVGDHHIPAKTKKIGKPVLTGVLILLLVLGASAAFLMWSSDSLPFAKKKTATVPALAQSGGQAVSGTLPPTADLVNPALPPVAGAVATPVPKATEDPKLQEQLARLEKRLDQLVAGFKAQGYIKEAAGQEGADLQVTDFLPHPSTLPPPAQVVAAPRPAAIRKPIPRPVVAPAPVKPAHQVLSVDMWDGRPSVVVGVTGAPAGQVRVLQPGDTYNGVTLTSVDVAGQRATFSDGARSVSIAVERQP